MERSRAFIACTRKVDRLQIAINAKDSNPQRPVLLHPCDGRDLQPDAWDNAGMEAIYLPGDIDPDNIDPDNIDPGDTDPNITCSDCRACCCRQEVMLMGEDVHVPAELTARDPWGGWVMRRLADGWCAALD
ncbi:MAG: hypothetical protein WCA64_00475, partial [Gallionella sp.]